MVQILALHCNFLTLHDFWSKSQYIKTIRFFRIIVFIIIEIIGLKKFLEPGLLLLDSNCSLKLVVERQWFRKLISDIYDKCANFIDFFEIFSLSRLIPRF